MDKLYSNKEIKSIEFTNNITKYNLNNNYNEYDKIINNYFQTKYNFIINNYKIVCEISFEEIQREIVDKDNQSPTFIIRHKHNCNCFHSHTPNSYIIVNKKKNKPLLLSDFIVEFITHESDNKLNCEHRFIHGWKFINDITLEFLCDL